MATVREKRPGTWELRVYVGVDERGRPKQVSRTFQGSERAARKHASDLERQYAGVTLAAVERTVEDAMADWQAAHVEWARLTKRDYASRARFVARDRAFARTRLDRLRRSDVDAWVSRMRLADVPEAAIKNRVAVVRSAIAHAVDVEHLPSNPIAGYRLRQPRKAERELLEDDVVAACIAAAAARGPVRHLAERLAAVTGARRSELAGLQWTDRTDDVVRFRRQVYVEDGVRRIDEHLKTSGSRRSVHLDPETVRVWEAAEQSQEFPSRFVFGDEGRDEPPSPDRVYRWHRQALADAGLDGTRLHDLRHWSASHGVASGHDIRTVADRLGNRPETVLRTYAHATNGARGALADTLGSLIDELQEPKDRRPGDPD
jgi:integrase